MTTHERTLIQIAKLALGAVDLEVAPPPATETEKPARKVKRKARRQRAQKPEPEPVKHNHRYICTDCQHAFKSPDSLLDVTCPNCDSTHIEKRPNKNSIP